MRRYFLLGGGGLLIAFAILFFTPGEHGALCSVAQAQDNPCLEEQATNTALQLDILNIQATGEALQAENANFQATITHLESQGGNAPSVPDTSIDCQPYPITETFDDNSRGISTISQDTGRARIVDGVLELRHSSGRFFVHLPGVCIQDNFYIEVTIQALQYASANYGIAIGNAEQNDYHVFGITKYDNVIMDISDNTRNNTLLDSDYGESFPDSTAGPVRYGLEGRNGIVTSFINGEELDAFPIPFKGDAVALYVGHGTARGGTTIAFDDFTIRLAR
jgi:hypothetical protein